MIPPIDGLVQLKSNDWRRLHQRLKAIGLNERAVDEVIAPGKSMPRPLQGPTLKWRARKVTTPAGWAMRMFVMHDPVDEREARLAFGDIPLELLLEAGLAQKTDGRVVSPFNMSIGDDLFIVCDDLSHGGEAAMGPGATTSAIARAAVPPTKVKKLLDVGCGAGSAALLLASFAEVVVATDISARAVAITKINAMFNGIDNLEATVGDLFAPVKGEQFDVIVSQPPFVPNATSNDSTTYLHGGARGDELPLRLLSQVEPVLAPGGRAFILVDWPVIDDEPLEDRVRAVVPSTDLDVLLVRGPEEGVDRRLTDHAWMEHPRLDDAFEEKVIALRDHVDRLGVRSFCMTVNVLRKATRSEGWTSTLTTRAFHDVVLSGERIDKHIGARDLLAQGRAALMAASLAFPEGLDLISTQDGRVRAQLAPHLLVPPILLNADAVRALQVIHQAPSVHDAMQTMHIPHEVEDALLGLVKSSLLSGLLEIA